MFKIVLYRIVTLPLDIVAFVLSFLLALMVILDRPICAAFGMKEEYNNGFNYLIEQWDELKDACKFDD